MELCLALKLQATLSSSAHSLDAALSLSTRQNKVFLYLKLHIACTLFSLGLTYSLSPSLHAVPAVSAALHLFPPLFFVFVFFNSIFGQRPLLVINVWCVAMYVSNHNSSMKSTLPGSDRHASAHSAPQCPILYKADFKYSHFRGDAPQWHEASRLNRSTALSLSLSFPLSLSLPLCRRTL